MTEARQTMHPSPTPDEPSAPLWHFGFIYDARTIIRIARDLQTKGGSPPGHAAVPDVDLERLESAYSSWLCDDKASNLPACDTRDVCIMLSWGTNFIQDYIRTNNMSRFMKEVYVGKPGVAMSARIIAVAFDSKWKFGDLELQDARRKLKEGHKLAKLTELLGPPEWYMSLQSACRPDIRPRLQSEEFQRNAGMPPVEEAPTTTQERPDGGIEQDRREV